VNPLEPADLSIYDRLCRSDDELESWLASGAHHRELAAQLGEAEYQLLAPLARAAASTRVSNDLQIFILPGIMGSQLGRVRTAPWPPNLLWVDPSDIIAGRLAELQLPGKGTFITMGAISFTYFALRLRLKAAGFAVRVFDYDWRLSLVQQGANLVQLLREAAPASVTGPQVGAATKGIALIAHSMGGLLARVALKHNGLEHVKRVITLGTPHNGTFAPVQALRGTYPSVQRLAALDQLHTAEQLAAEVFSTFISLYEMLPGAGTLSDLDLHSPRSWPTTGPQPRSELLRTASAFIAQLAPGDARFTSIVGTGIRTVTGLARRGDDFDYRITSLGDGTVPMASATLAGADNRYVHSEHSALPRSAPVAEAIIALLNGGACSLGAKPAVHHNAATAEVTVSDSTLQSNGGAKVDWRTLAADERRRYFNQLNLAPKQYSATQSQ
jgi:pimeloyl-ACP methyl ester carboxylesterase